MSGKLPFIQEAPPAPDIEEGDILKVTIGELEREEGQYGEQVRFNFSLKEGFQGRAWISYYEKPSDRSKLGKLLIKLHEKTGVIYKTVDEALEALKDYGEIFVKVKGFREWEGQTWPKFSIVADKLPVKEEQKQFGNPKKLTKEEVEKLTAGWPKEKTDNYVKYLKDTGQLDENL